MNPQDRWQKFCARMGVQSGIEDVFSVLDQGYAAKNRYYHNWQHISECLELLDQFGDVKQTSKELIEFAIWFHDVVYDSRAARNEEQSAEMACSCAQQLGVYTDQLPEISALIMATKDHIAVNAAAKVLIDIDLAILGADEARYDEYEADIRREYAWVPGIIFRRKRRQVLQSFLAREQIYQTAKLHSTHEAQARVNLQRAISAL